MNAKDPVDSTLLLALTAQTGEARGAPPEDAELQAWLDDSLDPDRRSEIASHLAHAPDVLSRLLALHDAAQASAAAAPSGEGNDNVVPISSGTRRESPWRLAATIAPVALAGVLALALYSSRSGQPQDGSDTPVLRGVEVSHPDWRVAAYRAGAAGQAIDAIVEREDCQTSADCDAMAGAIAEFGASTAYLRADCAAAAGPSGTVEPVIAEQIRTAETTLRQSIELIAWSGLAAQLGRSLDAPADVRCAKVDEIHTDLSGGS